MKIISLLVALSLVVPAAGCFVDTRPRRGPVYRERSCPPAHHWEGGVCVHNGNGRGRDRR